jgi:carbon monoxide dehydrogenase subunit G
VEFKGTVELPASRAAAWALLMDFERLAGCGPGVQSVEPIDDTHARVRARVGVGFMTLGFTIELEKTEIAEPDRAVVRAHANAPGNEADATGEMRLSGPPDGPTRMDWVATVDLHGAVARVGSRLIESTANRLIDQTFDCVRSRLATPAS